MEDRTARSSAPTEFEEKTATESRQKSAWLPNWRSFLVILPGLCTLVLWEIAAWQWPSVARLVSQPVEIGRGIVEVVATGTIWPHFDATLKEMAAGYVIGAITGVALGFLCGRIKLLGDILNHESNFVRMCFEHDPSGRSVPGQGGPGISVGVIFD